MKTLYIECNMGCAGDMLAASLLELVPDKQQFIDKINSIGLIGTHVSASPSEKCGIWGTRFSVSVNGHEEESIDTDGHHCHEDHGHGHEHSHEHHHEHSHSDLHHIEHVINSLNISSRVKSDALSVYKIIAEAESEAHQRPVSQVHFHEVGAMDAVADIVSVCMLIEQLAPECITASPVHVGSGQVRCAHGVLPVPAPATAHILKGVPTYGGAVSGELCTPTGAALLKYFCKSFGNMPVMSTDKIGYGMGKKDFAQANCVRAFIGQQNEESDMIASLSCNLDDMTGEALGFACQALFDAGALDVFTVPIQMKKGRPGVLLSCLCPASRADEFAALILRHTTTFGVRKVLCGRYTLSRSFGEKDTPYGKIKTKTGCGFGVSKTKLEFDSAAEAAISAGVPLSEVYK